jgi:hypothetical protein
MLDELDDIYDDTQNYYNILVGMFKAGMELNSFFSDEHKALRIVMFLRSDIYDNITYSDKNKWSDMSHEVDWAPDPDQRATDSNLFNLINLRIGASLVDIPKSDENYWNEVFPSYNVKGNLRPFQYILSRSYYRPRDVIQFCKEIQKANKKISKPEALKFDRRSVVNAEYSYSQWLLEEIIDEIHVKLPFVKEVFEAIKRHGKPTFTAKDINGQFARFRVQERLPVNSILRILFEFSVIGMFEDPSSNTPVFRYRDPYIDFKEKSIYSVHFGLRPALRIGGRYENRRRSGSSPTNRRR